MKNLQVFVILAVTANAHGAGLIFERAYPWSSTVSDVHPFSTLLERADLESGYKTYFADEHGKRRSIDSNLIVDMIDFEKDNRFNIVDDASFGWLVQERTSLSQVMSAVPGCRKYIAPWLKVLDKEIASFRAGNRRVDGRWLTAKEYKDYQLEQDRAVAKYETQLYEQRDSVAANVAIQQNTSKTETMSAFSTSVVERGQQSEQQGYHYDQFAAGAREAADALIEDWRQRGVVFASEFRGMMRYPYQSVSPTTIEVIYMLDYRNRAGTRLVAPYTIEVKQTGDGWEATGSKPGDARDLNTNPVIDPNGLYHRSPMENVIGDAMNRGPH